MRSFLELVSCCGHSVQQVVTEAPRRREETRALVPLSCAEGDATSGVKRGGSRSSAAWRPSLLSISENGAASPGRKQRTVGSAKDSARQERSTAKIRSRDDRKRFRHSSSTAPAALPAFPPAAFLF